MPKLYLTEHTAAGRYAGSSVPVADTANWIENANSPLNIGAPLTSAAFGPNTTLIRVHVDAICSVLVTDVGTPATTNNARMAANQTEYWYVRPGQFLSVIANT